jgi:hypothetical protein
MVRLRDGFVTSLTDPNNEAFPHHISTRNLNRPGWAYVSYYPSPGQRFNDEIVAVKLDGSKACERVAHMHSDFNGCYRCEPHAVPSPDGMRVIFASNWALDCIACPSTSDIKDYVVMLTGAPLAGALHPPPAPARLAFERVFPNPATTPPSVEYSLASGAPATLDLVDASGRRMLSQALGAPGPGRHVIQMSTGPTLAPGSYWLRLSQAGRSVTRRIAIVR